MDNDGPRNNFELLLKIADKRRIPKDLLQRVVEEKRYYIESTLTVPEKRKPWREGIWLNGRGLENVL